MEKLKQQFLEMDHHDVKQFIKNWLIPEFDFDCKDCVNGEASGLDKIFDNYKDYDNVALIVNRQNNTVEIKHGYYGHLIQRMEYGEFLRRI